MSIKKLDSSIISKLRSSFNVNSAAQCVVELVCNCLDAKASAIAVRINLLTYKVQVADNGDGISEKNLEFVAVRYATDKCRTLRDLERHLKTYGFRGEALASIVEMSQSVHINTRHKDSLVTYKKIVSKLESEIKQVKQRPSVGTTVTVFGWLSSVPVRQQRIVPEVELEEIKRYLESLIIINPNTSFTLRNDATGTMLLSSPRHDSIIHAFHYLHPDINSDFSLLKAAKDTVSVEAMIQEEPILSKNFQYLYINKKPVKSQKIIKHISKAFVRKISNRGKDPTFYNTKQHPVYIMHIKCPQKCIDNVDGEVELTCWDSVLACVSKLLDTLLKVPQKSSNGHGFQLIQNENKENLHCGPSQLGCAVQATAYKRTAVPCDSPSKIQGVTETEEEVISATPFKVPARSGFKRTQTTGDYRIQDSEEKIQVPMAMKLGMKKPLGIDVRPAGESYKEKSVVNFDQRSVYSRLTTDEHKGKDLIMDMFLKSTQVFKEDASKEALSDESKETVEESNFMFENNMNDHVRGINTTMSISVNVKRRKLNANKTSTAHNNQINCLKFDKDSNLFRRFSQDEPKMTCKEVQTSQKVLQKQKSFQTELTEKLDEFSLEQFSQRKSDYTILINTVQNKQRFRMVKRSKDMVSDEWPQPFKPLKTCHCEDEGNMFQFKDETFKKPDTPKLVFRGVRKESAKPPRQHEWNNCSESPYFKKTNIKHQLNMCGCQTNQFECEGNNQIFHNAGYENHLEDIPPCCQRNDLHDPEHVPAIYQKKYDSENYQVAVKNLNPALKCCEEQQYNRHFVGNLPKIQYRNLNPTKNDNQRRQSHLQNGAKNNPEFECCKQQKFHKRCFPNNLPQNRSEKVYLTEKEAHQNIQCHLENQKKNDNPDLGCCANQYHTRRSFEHLPVNQVENHCSILFKETHQIPHLPNELHKSGCYFQNKSKIASRPVEETRTSSKYNFENPHLQRIDNEYQKQAKYRVFRDNQIPVKHHLNVNKSSFNKQDKRRCNSDAVPFGDNKTSSRYKNQINFIPANQYHLESEFRCDESAPNQLFEFGCCKDPRSNDAGLEFCQEHHKQREHLPGNQPKPLGEMASNYINQDDPVLYAKQYYLQNEFRFDDEPPRNNEMSDLVEKNSKSKGNEPLCKCCLEHYKQRENFANLPKFQRKIFGDIKMSSKYNNQADPPIDQTAHQCHLQNEFRFDDDPSPNNEIFELDFHKENETHPNNYDSGLKNYQERCKQKKRLCEIQPTSLRDIQISSKYARPEASEIPLVSQPNNFNNKELMEIDDVVGSPDLFPTTSPTKDKPIDLMELGDFCDIKDVGLATPKATRLEITLPSPNERQKMVENELLQAKNIRKGNFFSFESPVEDKSRILVDSQNEWLRQQNEHGRRFFLNKRTGVVTVNTPTIPNIKFIFEERLGFIPKGMSPVMKGHKEVDKTLSQNAKNKLHNMILQGYEDELMFVKWKHFINNDPKSFFHQIYKEESNKYESCVPAINESNFKMSKNMHSFNVNIFGDMVVLGQLDKKFICAMSGDILVIFDQHAVHERIKVEKYLEEYKGFKAASTQKITVFLPHNDLALLKSHLPYLESLGLGVEFFTNGIHVTGIPLCIKDKFSGQDDLNKILNQLIKDTVDFLKNTRSSAIAHLPTIIQNIINHRACRAAIKFGTELSKRTCQSLLKDLAKCQLPFHCAHGRPTLAPVLSLRKVPEVTKKVRKVNLKKLRDPTIF